MYIWGWLVGLCLSTLIVFIFKTLNFTNHVVDLFLKDKIYIKFLLIFTNHALALLLKLQQKSLKQIFFLCILDKKLHLSFIGFIICKIKKYLEYKNKLDNHNKYFFKLLKYFK